MCRSLTVADVETDAEMNTAYTQDTKTQDRTQDKTQGTRLKTQDKTQDTRHKT